MFERLINHPAFELIFGIGLVTSAGLVIFPPDWLLLKWGANFAFQFLLGYLALGLLFFAVHQTRLMFVCFGCTAVLSLYLKYASNPNIRFEPETDGPSISMAHFNLGKRTDSLKVLELLRTNRADVISFEELSPQWDQLFQQRISDIWPHAYILPDTGSLGIGVFSRFPFSYIDTFRLGPLVNIEGRVEVDLFPGTGFSFIFANTLPAVNQEAFLFLKNNFSFLVEKVKASKLPLILLGNLHAVPWSEEIRQFRFNAGLMDSRRSFMPTADGEVPFLQIPETHIFFSEGLKCTQFSDLSDSGNANFGIIGKFQFIYDNDHD